MLLLGSGGQEAGKPGEAIAQKQSILGRQRLQPSSENQMRRADSNSALPGPPFFKSPWTWFWRKGSSSRKPIPGTSTWQGRMDTFFALQGLGQSWAQRTPLRLKLSRSVIVVCQQRKHLAGRGWKGHSEKERAEQRGKGSHSQGSTDFRPKHAARASAKKPCRSSYPHCTVPQSGELGNAGLSWVEQSPTQGVQTVWPQMPGGCIQSQLKMAIGMAKMDTHTHTQISLSCWSVTWSATYTSSAHNIPDMFLKSASVHDDLRRTAQLIHAPFLREQLH